MNYGHILFSFIGGLTYGIVCTYEGDSGQTVLYSLLIVAAFVFIGVGWFVSRRERVVVCSVLVFAFICGAVRTLAVEEEYIRINPYYLQAEVVAEGRIQENPVEARYEGKLYYKMTAELERLRSTKDSASGKYSDAKGNVVIYVLATKKNQSLLKRTREGQQLVFAGKIKPFTYSYLKGEPDRRSRHYTNLIMGSVFGAELLEVRDKDTPFLTRGYLRQAVKKRLYENLSTTEAVLLEGILFGADYSAMHRDITESFSRTGLIHILSVSGSHIALLFAVVYGIGRFLGLRKKKMAGWALGVSFFYAWLAGFSYPVIRSVFTVALATLGLYSDRKYISVYGLSLVMAVMLIWQPLALFDISFQLSFAAAFGLATFLSLLQERWHGQITIGKSALLLCVGAQIFATPFQLYYFQKLSPVMILANLVVAPLLESLICLGLLVSFCNWSWLYLLIHYLIKLALFLNFTLASIPYGEIKCGALSMVEGVLYFLLVIFFYQYLKYVLSRKQFVSYVLIGCFLAIGIESVISPRGQVQIPSFKQEQVVLYKERGKSILFLQRPQRGINERFWGDVKKMLAFESIYKLNMLIVSKHEYERSDNKIDALAAAWRAKVYVVSPEKGGSYSLAKDATLGIVGEKNGQLSLYIKNSKQLFILVNGQGGKKILQLNEGKKIILANGIMDLSLRDTYQLEREIFWKPSTAVLRNMELAEENCQFTFNERITPVDF